MAKTETGLTEAAFLILCTLDQPGHGYGIMKRLEEMSSGNVTLGPGTLYGTLKELLKQGHIRELASKESRRRLYETTTSGREMANQELRRLHQLIELGKGLRNKENDHE